MRGPTAQSRRQTRYLFAALFVFSKNRTIAPNKPVMILTRVMITVKEKLMVIDVWENPLAKIFEAQ